MVLTTSSVWMICEMYCIIAHVCACKELCFESQSVLMTHDPTVHIDLEQRHRSVDGRSLKHSQLLQQTSNFDVAKRTSIEVAIASQAAQTLGDGFDVNHETFRHSHLKVYFDMEMAQMNVETTNALRISHSKCKPKKVLVSGLPRSGSTALFDIANILMYFCDASFFPITERKSTLFVDDPTFHWEPFRNNRSAIIKSHTAKNDGRTSFPDIVLLSHRQPEPMLTSQWLSFAMPCEPMKPPCPEWSTVQREMERQACQYERFGLSKISYDMGLDELANNRTQVFLNVASALGIPQVQGTHELIAHAIHIYDRIKSLIQSGNQVSHRDNRKYSMLAQQQMATPFNYGPAFRVDPSKWSQGGGSITSNDLWDGKAQRVRPAVKNLVHWRWCRD